MNPESSGASFTYSFHDRDKFSRYTREITMKEMRTYEQKFAARHGNDIRLICDALRQSEIASRRKIVRRGPKRLRRVATR